MLNGELVTDEIAMPAIRPAGSMTQKASPWMGLNELTKSVLLAHDEYVGVEFTGRVTSFSPPPLSVETISAFSKTSNLPTEP
jgi:hypothetical protein